MCWLWLSLSGVVYEGRNAYVRAPTGLLHENSQTCPSFVVSGCGGCGGGNVQCCRKINRGGTCGDTGRGELKLLRGLSFMSFLFFLFVVGRVCVCVRGCGLGCGNCNGGRGCG